MTIPQALQIAVQRHQAGRLAEAEALYRQILSAQPNHAEALHLLGVIAVQAGRHDIAAEWIRKAILLDPNNPDAHSNLGVACRALGRLDEAIAAYRRAIELKPGYPQAHNNLGAALAEQGRLDEAIAAFRRAIELKPADPETFTNLGNALTGRGQFEEAIAAYLRAIELKPGHPETHNALGIALREQGRLREAASAFRRAIELRPASSEAHNNLGAVLAGQGRLDDAIASCRRALDLTPDYPEAHNNLGYALRGQRQLDEAAAACRRALQLKPDFPDALNNLAAALLGQGHLDDAVAACRRALELKPHFPEALNNLGNALKDQGLLDEATDAYRHALQMNPESAWLHSNLIYALHLHPGHNARTISEEHQRWNRQFSDPLKPLLQPHANDRSLDRRLRVGYVSPDFRNHPAGRYLLPLFERHDREQFEILCYSEAARPDWMTDRLRALSGIWRDTSGLSDARLAEIIREDRVDILVDLAMHTAGNRLPVFTRQPAPVQVTWLAYPGATGLPGIDYRLTDAHIDPPAENPASSAEEPVRLPDCWCCYDPAGESPEIHALPALSAGRITFGSLNNFAKVNETVLALWARILRAVKDSRLIMLCPEGQTRQRMRAFFDAREIAPERLESVSHLPRWEYLKLHHRIDIALDPFPCNGMTTTCDALWMGVPVLTLPGAMPVSRAGLSLLSSIGLEEFAASSHEHYLQLAVNLAANLPLLADLRATLRPRMLASPLMDATRFAQRVEAAYRSMWERWSSANG